MYRSINESRLLRIDIVDLLQDYVSVQLDIDEAKVKAAALIAQDIDIDKVLGNNIISSLVGICSIEDVEDDLKGVYENIIPAWCFFTYSRLLLMFHGNYSDSGFEIDNEASDRNTAKSVSKEHKSVGEFYLSKAIDLLKESDSTKETKKEKLTPRVRVFGGKENRASN